MEWEDIHGSWYSRYLVGNGVALLIPALIYTEDFRTAGRFVDYAGKICA